MSGTCTYMSSILNSEVYSQVLFLLFLLLLGTLRRYTYKVFCFLFLFPFLFFFLTSSSLVKTILSTPDYIGTCAKLFQTLEIDLERRKRIVYSTKVL